MLTLSLVFAFVLDRLVPDLRELRNRQPLDRYYRWLLAKIPLSESEPWMIPLLLVLPLVLAFALLQSLVDALLWDIFALGFYLAVAFLCIDSRLIFEEVDAKIAAAPAASDSPNASGAALLASVNSAYYSVVFWMLLGGPVILVFYRLVQRLAYDETLPHRQRWQAYIITMVAWLEWIPSLLTSFGYMICGNFEAGMTRFRAIPKIGDDMAELNRTRLGEVGMASVNASDKEGAGPEPLKRGRGLALRALMLWILAAALFEILF